MWMKFQNVSYNTYNMDGKVFKSQCMYVHHPHICTHLPYMYTRSMQNGTNFLMFAMFRGCTRALYTLRLYSAQFPVVASRASLLRETPLQVKKATEHREPLARFICGWTGDVPIWCQRYHRRVMGRHHQGVVRALRPSHVRQVGLTPCPGWTNWRSLGNVRQNLAHWRNSKASLWALLAWVAACHI